MGASNSWLLMALLPPTFWAIGCLIDSCLIGGRTYRTPVDGTIVSCLFCLIPVLLLFAYGAAPDASATGAFGLPVTAVAAGLAHVAHLFFYFRTLFALNDVSGAETFVSLSVLIVPLLAWLLLGEVLHARFYVAFGVAAIGVLLQCLPALRRTGLRLGIDMSACVVTVSLSMVLQADALETHGFAASTLAFNLACLVAAGCVLLADRRARRGVFGVFRRAAPVLAIGECLGILAVTSSHRATDLGPSVSLVALVECLLPLIIIAISVVLIGLNRLAPVLPADHARTLALQVRGVPSKILALTLLLISMASLSV